MNERTYLFLMKRGAGRVVCATRRGGERRRRRCRVPARGHVSRGGGRTSVQPEAGPPLVLAQRARGRCERAEQPWRVLRARDWLRAVVSKGSEVVSAGGAQQCGTAAMNLGYCFLRGHGVAPDKVVALRLFRVAVEQGEDRAAREVERLECDRAPRAAEPACRSSSPGTREEHLPVSSHSASCLVTVPGMLPARRYSRTRIATDTRRNSIRPRVLPLLPACHEASSYRMLLRGSGATVCEDSSRLGHQPE